MKNISVNNTGIKRLNKRSIHKIIAQLSDLLGFGIERLIINFVDEEEIIRINNEFLSHEGSTDIITFNYSGNTEIFDGEIFISFDDARKNAEIYGVSFSNEILRLIIHGILHMLGHKDIKTSEKRKMRFLEDKFMAELKNLEREIIR